MDFTKKMDEAVELFSELAKANSRKEKETLLEKLKANELGAKLVDLLKDEAVQALDFLAPLGKEKNDGRTRLGNFLQFVTIAENMATEKVSSWVFGFVMRDFDKEEIAMYKAILTNAISLPGQKEVKPVVVKESIELDKHQVNPKAIAKTKKQAG